MCECVFVCVNCTHYSASHTYNVTSTFRILIRICDAVQCICLTYTRTTLTTTNYTRSKSPNLRRESIMTYQHVLGHIAVHVLGSEVTHPRVERYSVGG